jgi:rod shape-determining protein MreD
LKEAIGLFVIIVAALAQTSIMPAFSIVGAHPNLVVVLLVVWMSIRGQREALLLIPVAGFALGLLDSQPLGLAMLALAPLILMADLRELRLVESELFLAIVLTVLATLAYESTSLVTLAVTGERIGLLATVLEVLVPATIANVLFLLPIYAIVRLASPDLRRQPVF